MSVNRFCNILGVPRSSYYAAQFETPKVERVPRNRIREAFKPMLRKLCLDNPVYGHRKIWVISREEHGLSCSSVYRNLKEQGLKIIPERHLKRTARRNYKEPLPKAKYPNHVWMIDITEIDIWAYGRYRVISVIDCFSRKIVVHRFCMRVRAEEVIELLQEAQERAQTLCGDLPEKIFLITDNGTQFTAWILQRYLAGTPFVHIRIIYRSPNGIANMERFHKNLKYEKIYRENYSDPVEAAAEVAKYIEWYNTKRIHQALDYLTPNWVYLNPESAKHFQPETVQKT